MKRATVLILLAVLSAPIVLDAVGGRDALYVGGTIPGLGEKVDGRFDTANDTDLIFIPKKTGSPVSIPYARVTELEYGQKAGRRVAMGILLSPLALFSKKRNHYLTISYTDAQGKEQAGVFELGKDVIRTTLKIVETRSGKEVQYQDEEARKSGIGGDRK